MTLAFDHLRIALAVCAAFALTGCPTVRMPELYHPGTAGYQRANALQFDPYPLDDVAPPVAGGRPKEYDRPIPEVKRGQAFTPRRPNVQPIAVPSFGPPASPVFSAPPALPAAPVSPFAPPANVPYQSAPPGAAPYQSPPMSSAPYSPPLPPPPGSVPYQSAPPAAMPYQPLPPAQPPTSNLVRPPY